MDGHTEAGKWPVTLEMTADQVEMLVRSIRGALLFSGSGKNSSGQTQDTMQEIAYREFLKEMIVIMEDALKKQRP